MNRTGKMSGMVMAYGGPPSIETNDEPEVFGPEPLWPSIEFSPEKMDQIKKFFEKTHYFMPTSGSIGRSAPTQQSDINSSDRIRVSARIDSGILRIKIHVNGLLHSELESETGNTITTEFEVNKED